MFGGLVEQEKTPAARFILQYQCMFFGPKSQAQYAGINNRKNTNKPCFMLLKA